MLTPTDRSWLLHQRDLLVSAAAKADIYGHALTIAYDVHTPWWRPFHALAVRRQKREIQRKRDVWADESERRWTVINAWITVHEITAGTARGPIQLLQADAERRRNGT